MNRDSLMNVVLSPVPGAAVARPVAVDAMGASDMKEAGWSTGSNFPCLPAILHATAANREAIARHLLALDADDRYRRFGQIVDDAVILRHVARIDFRRDVVLVAVGAAGGIDVEVLGLAHVALDPPVAEFGLSVLAGWRGRGFGRRLFIGAIWASTAAGVDSVSCVAGNPAVLDMARAAGLGIRLSSGEPRATLSLR
jgi:GNAT superfamily N-acetyltransferase